MYQVLARKWRPRNFAELVGQSHVAETLQNAIRSDRLAHAYIFSGLRGTGKTTVARVLAKCLNCEQGPTPDPCDSCASCTEVADSRSLDVLEIDAASRTKVEQTRELLEMVSYAPARDRNKILIIDEAHMLSKASFNALLKTLEEPPPNVMFVLATTELQKILPTILSRCQVFEFRRVPATELTPHLRRICDEEKVEISDSSLERVARAGEGSVRDSLSVLERVVAFCGQSVDDDQLLRLLGAVRVEILAEFLRGLAASDAGAMLGVVDQLADEGHDLLQFWNELISALRDLLLHRELPDRGDLLGRSAEEIGALADAASTLSGDDLSRAFKLVADLELPLKSSSRPRFLFEAGLIRLASLGHLRPIEEILSGAAPAPPAAPGRPPQKKKAEPAPLNRAEPPPPPSPSPAAASFSAILTALRDERPMLAAMLEQAASIRPEKEILAIRFPRAAESLASQLRQPDRISQLESLCGKLVGRQLRVEIIVSDEPGEAPPSRPTSKREDPKPEKAAEPPPKAAEPGKQRGGGLLEKAREEPGIRRLLDSFGAQVVEIRPDGTRKDTDDTLDH